MKTKKFINKKEPLCMVYDSTMCVFSNGDELNIVDSDVSNATYDNGYLLELELFDHKSKETWTGIVVFVTQGWIHLVWHYEASYLENWGFCGIDSMSLDDSAPAVMTPIYMDAPTEWRALLFACEQFV